MADYGSDLIGDHPGMIALRRLVSRVAHSPARTVLIYGETGTGKGLVARMLHQESDRADREFMDINCAAIPASLMESELFGHEKGAFTGALDRKIGLVEAANRGTIFLDEIREMDLTLQAKLLSLLDSHQFRRVGAVRSTRVDVRFIALELCRHPQWVLLWNRGGTERTEVVTALRRRSQLIQCLVH